MKIRSLSFFLAICLIASIFLPACQEQEEVKTTGESLAVTTEEKTSQEETKTAPKIEYLPNRLKAADVAAFPIATDDLSYAERRQMVLDFFRLQVSFNWTTNFDITDYDMTYGSSKKAILAKNIYGGIPYQSTGNGNVYRWLEYYDEETAVMDFEKAIAENGGIGEGAAMTDVRQNADGTTYKKYRSLMTFFNQCSSNSFGGWGRVMNSAYYYYTADMNVKNGFIPVGFTYPNMHVIDRFGEETAANPDAYDTDDVIRDWNEKNGKNGMYQCYAQAKPGDLLVNTGHTLMVKEIRLYNKPDGTPDYESCFITIQEQPEVWAEKSRLHGKELYVQGVSEQNYTFKKLQSQNYIPFTFAELLDPSLPEDNALLDTYYENLKVTGSPAAKCYTRFSFTEEELSKMAGVGVEKAVVFTTLTEGAKEITYAEFEDMAVGSNYTLSDVFVTVLDQDGKELKKNIYRAPNVSVREMNMKKNHSTWKTDDAGNLLDMTEGISELATGENTIEITVQLFNGEKLTAFSGKLNP